MQPKQVLERSGIVFGTSGARGLVEDLTDEVCAAFTAAFLLVMAEEAPVRRLAIGRDLRPSSPRMVAACTAAARAMGVAVHDYGALSTPALALKAVADGVPAIIVTGSLIPFDRNCIKVYRSDGEITKADEQAIMAVDKAMPVLGEVVQQAEDPRAVETYKARYLEWFACQSLKGARIGLY